MTRPNQTAEELEVFRSFSKHYPSTLSAIDSRTPPEPDILCTTTSGSQRAFEIVEIIDQEFARANQSMLTLKSEFERSFSSLGSTQKSALQTVLNNAAVFVTYADGTTLQERCTAIPAILKFLTGVNSTAVGDFNADGMPGLKPIVKMVRILRGNFNGPSWNVTTVGLLSDPSMQRLADKFAKRYTSTAEAIELLAYFRFQPKPLPDFVPIIEDFTKTNIWISQFSAVWMYSVPGDKVLMSVQK
jgi:hypothetical protein